MSTLSESDQKFLAHAWTCLKGGPPEIDYAKLAPLVGHANPKSTSNQWANIKKKLNLINGDSGGDVSGTPSKGSKRAAKATATSKKKSESAEASTSVPSTPVTATAAARAEIKARTTPKRSVAGKRKYVESESDGEEEGDEVAVKAEDGAEDGEEEGLTTPKTDGAKVKSKKEGAKSPSKSPTKRAVKKVKTESDEDGEYGASAAEKDGPKLMEEEDEDEE